MLLKSLHILRIVAQPKTFLVGTVLAIATGLAAAALGTSTQIHQLGRGHVRWITALARPFHAAVHGGHDQPFALIAPAAAYVIQFVVAELAGLLPLCQAPLKLLKVLGSFLVGHFPAFACGQRL